MIASKSNNSRAYRRIQPNKCPLSLNLLLKESLASSVWQIREEQKNDGLQRTSISRYSSADQGIYPDINLEIVKKDGKFIIQLSINI